MHSLESISKLIADVYDGVAEPARWSDALHHFVNLSGGRLAVFATIDSSTQTMPTFGIAGMEKLSDEVTLELHRELFSADPSIRYASAAPDGGVFRFFDNCSAMNVEMEAWRKFIRDSLGSEDYHSRFSAERDGLRLVLALYAPAGQLTLTPEQQQLHAIVFDHLQRAIHLAYRPPDLRQALRPILLVNIHGDILDASASAQTILATSDSLTAAQGRLRALNLSENQRLNFLINLTCRGGAYGKAEQYCFVSSSSGKRGHLLRLGLFPAPHFGRQGTTNRCLVEILGSEEEEQLPPEQLRTLFSLTMREAEIAALFASSFNDLRSIAAHLGISHETARVHVRSIFAKLGVHNQVELVRILGQLK